MKNKQPLGPDQKELGDRIKTNNTKKRKEKVVIGGGVVGVATILVAIGRAIFGRNNNNN